MDKTRGPLIQDEGAAVGLVALNLGAAVAALEDKGLLCDRPAIPVVVNLPSEINAWDIGLELFVRLNSRKETGNGTA